MPSFRAATLCLLLVSIAVLYGLVWVNGPRVSSFSGMVGQALYGPHAAVLIDLEAVRKGDAAVPRQAAALLPRELPEMTDVAARKAMFLSAVLPLVLLVNEEILVERTRLLALYTLVQTGGTLSRDDRAWVAHLAAKYEAAPDDFATLLLRVDALSPALALAQAAEESGWGRSRFAQEGNALFGELTWVRGAGIIPASRNEGATHEVRSFDTLLDSVRSYARNLNTHPSYARLRELRGTMRTEGEDLKALTLATALTDYSERGGAYVDSLQAIIRANRLSPLELAQLASAASERAQLATRTAP